MSSNDKSAPIRSLIRGIAVLQAINRGRSLTMMEIARASEVPYPTACRIVQTLLHEGMIEREPARKRYRPTALVQTLAHGFQGDAQLVTVARPLIVELTRRVAWPIALATHVGHSMIIRDSTHALTALTFNQYFPGFDLPILESAAGLAYLSFIDAESRQMILTALKLLPKLNNMHVVDLLENGALVEEIVRNGYATRGYNRFTHNPGKTSSIAVPIFAPDGNINGTLSLAFFAAAAKMDDAVEQYVGPLQECASAITSGLAGVS